MTRASAPRRRPTVLKPTRSHGRMARVLVATTRAQRGFGVEQPLGDRPLGGGDSNAHPATGFLSDGQSPKAM
jgi:hypothetical protein